MQYTGAMNTFVTTIEIWVIVFFAFFGVIGLIKYKLGSRDKEEGEELSMYERKPYLMDTNSEFALYKILVELFGEQYFIFPQINYSHLIKVKAEVANERMYRSRIDRKSADFVFCDKEHVVPKLIIELDGYVHAYPSKQRRDAFINEITKVADLPILHLPTTHFDKEVIRAAIAEKLTPQSTL